MAGKEEWWRYPHGPRSYSALRQEVRNRLSRAVSRHGWPNEKAAATDLGGEMMAAVRKLCCGWVRLCEDSQEEGLAESVDRIAEHLWGVRIGDEPSFLRADGEVADMRGLLENLFAVPGSSPGGRQSQGPKDGPTALVNGRDLAYALAVVLKGDPDMTPVAEARHIWIQADRAEAIAREMVDQWRSSGMTDKSIFKRLLTRRLSENSAGFQP